jgi:hypothetical protein
LQISCPDNFALPRNGAGHCGNQIDLHEIKAISLTPGFSQVGATDSFRSSRFNGFQPDEIRRD